MDKQKQGTGLGTIRIEGDGMPGTSELYLDGHNISKFVQHVSIDIGVERLPSVTLKLVGYVEFSDELKALIDLYAEPEIDFAALGEAPGKAYS